MITSLKKFGKLISSLWKRLYGWIKKFQSDNEPVFRLLEVSIVVAALYLTVQAGIQQDKFESVLTNRLTELNRSFDQVDSSLISLPDRINDFSSAIASLSEVANQQKSDLERALANLGSSVNRFDSSLESYGDVFRRLAEVNKGQIELLDKQQDIIMQQLNRKSDLHVYISDRAAISGDTSRIQVGVINWGNGFSDFCDITLYFNKTIEVVSSGFQSFSTLGVVAGDSIGYTYQIKDFHIAPAIYDTIGSTKRGITFSNPKMYLTLVSRDISSKPVRITYIVQFRDGSNRGELVLDFK